MGSSAFLTGLGLITGNSNLILKGHEAAERSGTEQDFGKLFGSFGSGQGTAPQAPFSAPTAPSSMPGIGGPSPTTPAGGMRAAAGSLQGNYGGDYVNRVVGLESGGNPNARSTTSSATGAGQFINSTWLNAVKKHRPDLAQGRTDQQILSLRTDPNLSREMIAAYGRDNAEFLQSRGLGTGPTEVYAAHNLGPAGAAKVLSAAPDTTLASLLGPEAMRANPHMRNMTARTYLQSISGKMGGGGGGAPAPAPSPVASGGGLPQIAGGMFTLANPQHREALARIAARNPEIGKAFIARMIGGGGEGFTLGQGQRRYDASGRLIAEGAPTEQFFPLVSPEHRARFGIPPEDKRPYQVNPTTGEVRAVGGAGTNISIDQGEKSFEQEIGKKNAALFSGMADQWTQSQSDLADISQLRELLPQMGPGGIVGAANKALAKWGVRVEGGGAIQTFEAVINRLVPAQRAPGSGTMSDGDVQLFKQSLPQLMNTPEGNQRILDTMEAMARYKMQQAIIAQNLMADGGSKEARQEAFKALRELKNPLEWLRGLRPSKEGTQAAPQQPNAAPEQPPKPEIRQPSKSELDAAREAIRLQTYGPQTRETILNLFRQRGVDPSGL